jgi:nucleosome assembly protein 1-like 1
MAENEDEILNENVGQDEEDAQDDVPLAREIDDLGVDDEDDDEEDPLAHLPGYVLARVEKLKELNEQREEAIAAYLEDRAALELKYQALYKPLYEERSAIVCGEQDEEIAREGGSVPNANDLDSPSVKGIPQFWAAAMTNYDTVGEVIAEEDVDCLESLQNITCVDDDDGKGFTLRFHFAPNDYFYDTILTKKYQVPNLLLSDEPILKNVSGCKIQWKKDKSLTFQSVKKKQRGKGRNAGQVRTVAKTERKESFFHWFDPPEMPPMETMDEEEAERLEEELDADYEIAQSFRSHIIPKAVVWFSGEVRTRMITRMLGIIVNLQPAPCLVNQFYLTHEVFSFLG